MASHPSSFDPGIDLASPRGPLVIQPARVRSARGQRVAALLIGLLAAIVGLGLAGPRTSDPAVGPSHVATQAADVDAAARIGDPAASARADDAVEAALGRTPGPTVDVAAIGSGSGLRVVTGVDLAVGSVWIRLSSGPTILVERRVPASAGAATALLTPDVPQGGLLATLVVAAERPDGSTTARAVEVTLRGAGARGLAVDPATGRTRLATDPLRGGARP